MGIYVVRFLKNCTKFAERIGYCFCMYLLLCLVAQSCPTLCNPMNCSPPGSSCPWGFSRQEYWSGLPCPPPGDLPKPRSPTLQEKSLPSEPSGKRTCNYLQIIKVNEVQQRMCQIIYKVNVCTHVHVAEKDSLSTYCICSCILNINPIP